MVKKILVATDFSERSDRALRRATLLARQYHASLTLVHVVDDDAPRDLVDQEKANAEELLLRLASTCKSVDGVDCDTRLELADAFTGLVRAAEDTQPDLLVMGPHRRQLLGDVFVGTTAERTIRSVPVPVLMVNAVTSGRYHHILETTDLSDLSADALVRFRALGLCQDARQSILHVFESPALGHVTANSVTRDERERHLAKESGYARDRLVEFLSARKLNGPRPVVRYQATSAGHEILDAAQEESADLVVVSTHGRTGLAKLLLGSVTEKILRSSPVDVIAIPASR